MRITSRSQSETVEIGMKIGESLNVGDVLCLYGDLGSGKTAFVQGIAKGLGFEDFISSPTFTIVNEYNTIIPLFHFDVYRVHDPDELFAIGFEEYFEKEGIVVIEWAELISEIIPVDRIDVFISKSELDENERLIEIVAQGTKYAPFGERLKKSLRKNGGFYESSGS